MQSAETLLDELDAVVHSLECQYVKLSFLEIINLELSTSSKLSKSVEKGKEVQVAKKRRKIEKFLPSKSAFPPV